MIPKQAAGRGLEGLEQRVVGAGKQSLLGGDTGERRSVGEKSRLGNAEPGGNIGGILGSAAPEHLQRGHNVAQAEARSCASFASGVVHLIAASADKQGLREQVARGGGITGAQSAHTGLVQLAEAGIGVLRSAFNRAAPPPLLLLAFLLRRSGCPRHG
jgi:hypothetical protein